MAVNKNVAIVTGSLGQDGSTLCELLLDEGYIVYGIQRRSPRSSNNLINCVGNPSFHIVELDITDSSGMRNLIRDIKPELLFNTAAMSHVAQSFKEPLQTLRINGEAVTSMLEAIRHESPSTRFLTCSTSEQFGSNGSRIMKTGSGEYAGRIQDENTPFSPSSPYAAAKVYAHQMVGMYRKAYGLHATCSICFNHESTKRPTDFVTRKITNGIAMIKYGLKDHITLGNLKPFRDFGHCRDYVRAMYMIATAETPDDYVIATGEAISIQQVLEYVCELAGLDWQKVYKIDERFMRPSDVPYLRGNPSKIKTVLGWKPEYNWKSLLKEMYDYDCSLMQVYNSIGEKEKEIIKGQL